MLVTASFLFNFIFIKHQVSSTSTSGNCFSVKMAATKKLRYFKIVMDDESLLYFPGAFLTGKVVLELDEDTPILGLFFHIKGEGVVRLVGSGGIVTSDKENYIDFRMRLLGDNLTRIGERKLRFSEIQLPQSESIPLLRHPKHTEFKCVHESTVDALCRRPYG